MKFRKAIISLSILVALLPFIGIPQGLKTILFAILGLTIALLGYLLAPKVREHIFKGSSDKDSAARDDAEEIMNEHKNEQHDPGNHIA